MITTITLQETGIEKEIETGIETKIEIGIETETGIDTRVEKEVMEETEIMKNMTNIYDENPLEINRSIPIVKMIINKILPKS